MEISWKNRLQEYCQKKKLPLPDYMIRQQPDHPNAIKFQMGVKVDGRWYTGEENCSSKREAEHSAAQKAYTDLMRDNVDYINQEHRSIDPSRHMPLEYADVEDYIATMIGAFGGRIRKVIPPNTARGLYKLEIIGNYRLCNNIGRQHRKNQVYFLVDPVKKIYFQRCHDPDCQGFQSAKQPIYTDSPVNTNLC